MNSFSIGSYFLPPSPFIQEFEYFSDDLDAVLVEINEQTLSLERGFSSQFDPSKLNPLFLHLKKAIQLARDKTTGIEALQGVFLDWIAIQNTVQRYLIVAQKIIESDGHGKNGQATEIRNWISQAEENLPLDDFQKPSIFCEFYDGIRHPIENLFPSLERQKNHLRERFFNGAREFFSFLEKFKDLKPETNLLKNLSFQREARRFRESDKKDQEEMSESRKWFWNGIFSFLQLSSQAIQFSKRESIATLLSQEKQRHTHAPLAKGQKKKVSGTDSPVVKLKRIHRIDWKPDPSPSCFSGPERIRQCAEHCEDLQSRGIKIYEYEEGTAKTIIFSRSDVQSKLSTPTANQILKINGIIENRQGMCFYASAFLFHKIPNANVIESFVDLDAPNVPSFYPFLLGAHHQFGYMNAEKGEYFILDPTIPKTYLGHNTVLIVESSKVDLEDTYNCVFGHNNYEITQNPIDDYYDYDDNSMETKIAILSKILKKRTFS